MPNSAPMRITLGSGKLYMAEYSGDSVPDEDTLCVEGNLVGLIQGGATISYTPEYYEATDDLGLVKKTVITSEEATLTTGIMTWNGDTLAKLCETGRVTEATGKRTVKIGGVANATGKNYAVCFHHEDAADGDKWVTMVGRNQSGFEFAFAKDQETVIDAEIKAVPQDDEGTLIRYVEEDGSVVAG